MSLPFVEIAARLVGRFAVGRGRSFSPYDAIFMSHDAAVAAMPWPRGTTDVYAYEDGALWTFERARRSGLGRIWDLPLPHWATIRALYREEARRWPDALAGGFTDVPEWKQQRKDQELALATKICVASSFTRQSLERLEVSQPIVVVPYGFPVDEFRPRQQQPNGRFQVLSVGTHDLRKGTPYLLEAWRRAAIPEAELQLVGPLRLPRSFMDRYAGSFFHRPHIAKSELQAAYARADLLAFPTLGDGFGLVMQEAMCAGVPVLTTPCGGGPECITSGIDGWLVPPRSIDALVETFRFAAGHRDRVFQMGRAARARAERWTWRDAQGRLINLILPTSPMAQSTPASE
jgi:glycosyltransferase involved in cell wall biosynthesis